jgi:hypothetical protein
MADPSKKRRIDTVIQDAVPGVGLDALPRAVLLEVLSFCVLVDTARFRTVTKKTLAIPAWKVLSLNMKELKKSPLPLLQTLSLFATHTEELYCDSIAWENATSWVEVLKRMPRLARVTFHTSHGEHLPREEDLMHIVRHPAMVDLEINTSRMGFNVSSLTSILKASHLERLSLAGLFSVIEEKSEVAATFVSSLPTTLTELRLNLLMAVSGDVIQTLLAHCPHLTRLQLLLNAACDKPAIPDDWRWLYTPPRRWHEITLQSARSWYGPHPCLKPAALVHFARAKVQHTLRIDDWRLPTWTKEMWKDFVGQPIRVLTYGLAPDVGFDDTPVEDALGTLMDTFPFLETIPDCQSLYAESKSLIRAYKDRWPLLETCRQFPPVAPFIDLIHSSDRDVKEVIDFLATGVANDRFNTLRVERGTPHANGFGRLVEPLIQSQRTWTKLVLDGCEEVRLSQPTLAHLASMGTLESISIQAGRLEISTGLLDILERGRFESIGIYTTGTPVQLDMSMDVLLQMWRQTKRRYVRLHGVVLRGIRADEWERVMTSKEWVPGPDRTYLEFSCLVPSANAPTNSPPLQPVEWIAAPSSPGFSFLKWTAVN